jgi:formylglycine-generating enzyme required for sulfatase activity
MANNNRFLGAAVMSRKSPGAAIGVFLGLWAGFLAVSSPAQEPGKKLALLVGVDKYEAGSGFSSLSFPQRDVDALAQLLRDSGYRPEHIRVLTLEKGFKDELRFLPNGRNVLREFRLLAASRKPQDSLLVALVGHGLTRKVKVKDAAGNEVERLTGFFCPQDAEINITESMISVDDLYAELEKSQAGVKVMFVDACREIKPEARGNTEVIPLSSLALPPVQHSVAALFSCSDGELAYEEPKLGGGHGVFFHFVIEGLKGAADSNSDLKITLNELNTYTADKVTDFVSNRFGKSQNPVLQGRTPSVTLLDLAHGTAPEFITTRIGQIRLKRLPAGSFLMGSPDDDKEAYGDEKPQHRVRISKSFYLGVYEVTQAQYEAVMGNNPSDFSPNGSGKDKVAGQSSGQHPVENVSWLDAVTFCNKLSEKEGRKPFYEIDGKDVRILDWNGPGYRLPTEAEWEYACRGNASTPTRYSFGDDAAELGEYGWFGGNSESRTHPVGEKKPNGFGLHDMHGNVWEWCWDWYGEGYYKQSSAADPTGSEPASARVYRGGGWYFLPRSCRSANRFRNAPVIRNSYLGFRLALVQSVR